VVEKYNPTCFSVEKVFFGKNADSAFKLGQARGVAIAIAGRRHLPVFEYATRSVKKVLTSNGGATKEQVQLMVERWLNIREPSLDATDALALAICHSRQTEVDERFKAQEKMSREKRVQL
jgi:crossover junction endodeoxyribonuclease RuvC